jgi:hypothetical protein
MSIGDRPASPVAPSAFDAYYYEHCCGRPYQHDDHWLTFFGRIADRIVADIGPRKVMDAGCAMGFLVEALRARGVEAWGIDISSYAIERVDPSVKPFCRQGSITEPFPQRVDLVVCIEVLEHVLAADADAAILNFCANTDAVLFSSSPTDHREPTHVNVRPAEDWAERFARAGFFRDVDFDASVITPWAVLFRKSDEPVSRLVRRFERRLARLEHERVDLRSSTLEAHTRQRAAEEAVTTLEANVESLRAALQAAEQQTLAQSERARIAEQQLTTESGRTRHSQEAVRNLEQHVRALTERAQAAEQTIRNMERSLFWRLRKVFRR